jgi:integrase
MQRGCMQRNNRNEGLDVWQFRWSETSLDGKRLYPKKTIGTVEQYPDENAARDAVIGLVSQNNDPRSTNSGTTTELAKENTWRSYATKKIYEAYLTR